MSAELPCMMADDDQRRCKRHDKNLEYVCETHSFHICADCAVFDHRECKVTTSNTENAYDKLSSVISPVLIQATHRIGDVNSKLSRLLQSRDNVALTIVKCFQKMRQAIDAAESEQYSQLEFLYTVEESRLLEWKENCQQLMNKAKTKLEDAKNSCAEIPTQNDKLQKEFGILEKQITDCLQGNDTNVLFVFNENVDFEKVIGQFAFLPGKVVVKHESPDTDKQTTGNRQNPWTGINPHSSAILSESETEYFVDIPLDGSIATSKDVPSTETSGSDHKDAETSDNPVKGPEAIVSDTDPASLSLSNRLRSMSMLNVNYFLSLKSSFNALMPSDKSHCWLTGATFLVNNSIAVTDRKNKKVKLFSSALHCIAEVVMSSNPFDVAQTGNYDLVVTIPKQKRVQFFGSEDLKALPLYIDTEQTCLGISSTIEVIAVVCEATWSRSITIKIYDNEGALLRKVARINDDRELAFTTEYISLCPVSGNMAFRNGIRLFFTTSEGDLLWTSLIPNQFLSNNIRGLATLNGGVLVVFDLCVYFVTSDGHQWKKVTTFSRQTSPSAICVSRSKSSVLITHTDPIRNRTENNLVEIFTINQQFE